MTSLELIANSLGGAKKTAEGYLCKCPCHEDKTASLSIKITEKGHLGLNCFAGCNWKDIKTAIEQRGLIEKPRLKRDRYAGAKFYIYKDLVGNILCRKVKLPDKKMWFERYEAGEWKPGLNKMTVPLYNLQAVIESEIIYLCEGEKDAETLISFGLCGTTNHAGAKSWAPHLTEQLKNKTVIIIPDNDDAGRKRIRIVSKALEGIAKEIRVFLPDGVPEKGDITDWVEAGNKPTDILTRSIVTERETARRSASREDYFELIETTLNFPRKCIFNEKLMYKKNGTELWNPAINAIDILKSEALFQNETRESKFNVSAILPHFSQYEENKQPEFLVDIPEWDGEDRISAMAYLITLRESGGVSINSFSELLKEWCALVFKRLENPMVQNRILILQGGQGIGKDTWISMLVDGLGQFSITLNVIGEDKDTFLALHDGLIIKISEYDKTSRTEVSTLKDIITTPSTNLRAPYERDRKIRYSRCSFISSANVDDLLKDYTGARRYLIFEIESIEYAYEGWSIAKIKDWQMQCLAEMKYLAETNYTASNESWREMRDYLDAKTPTDPAVEIIETLNRRIRKADMGLGVSSIEIMTSDSRLEDAIRDVAKETGTKPRIINRMLRDKIGTKRRIGDTRFWVLKFPELPDTLYFTPSSI